MLKYLVSGFFSLQKFYSVWGEEVIVGVENKMSSSLLCFFTYTSVHRRSHCMAQNTARIIIKEKSQILVYVLL